MAKIQVNTTLDPENVNWLDEGIAENRFPSRSAGVDLVISAIRRLESPEAVAQKLAEEKRLRDAEDRARRAEAAIDVIEQKLGVPIDEIEQRLNLLVNKCEESFQSLREESNRAADLVALYVNQLARAEAELFELKKAQKAEVTE